MSEVRLVEKGEIIRLKEIWKLCFGDSDTYIDFYYANRYKENETVVLLHDEEISGMLTMIAAQIVTPDNRSFKSAMLYAIATHPKYQNRGFATQLMDFCNQYLRTNTVDFSILVPAEKQLFDFYYKQGYKDGFYIREILLTREAIDRLPFQQFFKCEILAITPKEYNQRRNNQLDGRFYVKYADKDITYQKKLSRQSGADIYAINFEDIQGCVAIERVSSDKVFIKEILVPEQIVYGVIKEIVQILDAKEYIVRTPAYFGNQLGGSIRPFGMIRVQSGIELEITPEKLGYLGFAFD
jgi:ribosomal protein S18 acetylase RimI-like enzyme